MTNYLDPMWLPDGWTRPTHDSVKARMCRLAHRGFGFCGRCGLPWSVVEGHSTRYSINSSCFPLCEGCWAILGHPEARIEYYKVLVDRWELGHPVDEETKIGIMKAVANGG